MVKIFNLGSINLDYVYELASFPKGGETLPSQHHSIHLGGKGANQSLAIARALGKEKAQSSLIHIGAIAKKDRAMLSPLQDAGISLLHVKSLEDTASGHAIIALDKQSGENFIILHEGANGTMTRGDYAEILGEVRGDGNWALTQNETNQSVDFLKMAKDRGMKICYSAAPFDAVKILELQNIIDLLILNEGEAQALCQALQCESEQILSKLHLQQFIMTLGKKGAVLYRHDHVPLFMNAPTVKALDTTGAGDCFLGYYLAQIAQNIACENALQTAIFASALCVTKLGASSSIPTLKEVESFRLKL